jgi:prepilin-type N-terminal cleavage/methylation domain-containing protein/prepilin-type processing-associated H-X9-DG protein
MVLRHPRQTWGGRGGFTLIELLVVIGIIAVLLGILMPALGAARAEGRAVACLSNVRGLAAAAHMYAGDFRGRFPPNLSSPAPGQWWCDDGRVGQYVARGGVTAANRAALVCPADEDAGRSYAMNVWASSRVDAYMLADAPPRGRLWKPGDRDADRVILFVEAWSTLKTADVWLAQPFVGYAGLTPGQRFGAGGIPINATRWGMVQSELPFYRHRSRRLDGSLNLPVGRVTVAYADGHAGLRSSTDLADPATGLSTLDSLWTTIDPSLNH